MIVVERSTSPAGALLYIDQSARKWILSDNCKKPIASYLNKHYNDLSDYARFGGRGDLNGAWDLFVVRGYVKARAYLTAALLRQTVSNSSYVEADHSLWVAPEHIRKIEAERNRDVLPRLLFSGSTLTDHRKVIFFATAHMAGPLKEIYPPASPIPRRKTTLPTRQAEDGSAEPPKDSSLKNLEVDDSESDVSTSLHDEQTVRKETITVDSSSSGILGRLERFFSKDSPSSSSSQDVRATTALANEILASLEDPHNQCVIIFPVRARRKPVWLQLKASAAPVDLAHHRDDDVLPAVPAEYLVHHDEQVCLFGCYSV